MKEATAFPQMGKTDWLARAAKELKGKDPSELDWALNEKIRLSPLYTPAEVPARGALAIDNDWLAGSYVGASNARSMNGLALEELAGGAQAVLFNLHHQPSPDEIAQILEGIELPFISLHCSLYFPDRDPAELFRDLIFYLRKKGYPLASIRGAVDFDPLFDWSDPPIEPLVRLLRFVAAYMPGFRVLQVNGNAFNTGPERADAELALTVAKGVEYLNMLRNRGFDAATANKHMQFSLSLGKSFYVDVAKLRALRILWANVLQGFEVPQIVLPRLEAHSGIDSLTTDMNTNLLQLTTQALAAVTGGADLLFLHPADVAAKGGETATGRRLSRNIQQLLRLEAGLAEIADPAAGSFYLETLTNELAKSAWEQFLEIEDQGGFAEVQSI